MPLSFRPYTGPPTPLPKGFTRTYIKTPGGSLELIAALPEEKSTASPLFFCHGGFGCAAVWLEYMTMLSAAPYNIPCYAISLRGHGTSWNPGYFRMTFGTTRRMFADDLASGVRHIEQIQRERGLSDTRVVLAAHSAGGGIAQLALNDGDFQVKGLALLDAAPPSGLLPVYWNWFKADPWFPLRVYPHLMHSRSPLSSTRLVKKIFFCDDYPISRVPAFEALMAPFESLLWPMSIMTRFCRLDRVLSNILLAPGRQSVLIVAAEKSRLMGPAIMKGAADEYADALEVAVQNQDKIDRQLSGKELVRFEIVAGAAHHLQNDLNWEEGARKLADWWQALT